MGSGVREIGVLLLKICSTLGTFPPFTLWKMASKISISLYGDISQVIITFCLDTDSEQNISIKRKEKKGRVVETPFCQDTCIWGL